MKTFIFYTFVLYCFVLWPMTVNSHYNENNILKRISRSNDASLSSSSITTTIPTEKVKDITLPKMNLESSDSTASSNSSIPNDFQTTLAPELPLQNNKRINEDDTFQNTLPDQNYSNFVIVFFSAMLILILGLLFIVIYKKQGNSFYQVRGIRRHHQETPA